MIVLPLSWILVEGVAVWVLPKFGCNLKGKNLWFRVIWECVHTTNHCHTTIKLEFYRLFEKSSKWFRLFLIFTDCYCPHYKLFVFLLLLAILNHFVHFKFDLIVCLPHFTNFVGAFDQLFHSFLYFNSVLFTVVLLKWPKRMGTRLRQQTSFIKWFEDIDCLWSG